MSESGHTASTAHAHLEELIENIQERIEDLEEDVGFWRPRAFGGHFSMAILGAAITVIAGLQGSAPKFFADIPSVFTQRNNWVLVLGAIVTGVSAWQAFYRHRDKWASSDTAAKKLRAFLTKLRFRMGSPDFDLKTDAAKLFEEYSEIVAELDYTEPTATRVSEGTEKERAGKVRAAKSAKTLEPEK